MREKLLVLVMTYPTTSRKYGSTVCCGGITDDDEFRRIFPVPFDFFREGGFHKRHYIEYDVTEVSSDGRKESRKIDTKSIKFLDYKMDYDEGVRAICRRHVTSIEALQEAWDRDRTSCGIVKPRLIDFEVFPRQSTDTTIQSTLIDGGVMPEMLDYIFYYRFNCSETCDKIHRISCLDIEAGELFRKLKEKYPINEAIGRFREKSLTWMRDTRELYFIMGTHAYHPNVWMIGSLLYPRKQINRTLFEFGQSS